MFRLGRGSWQLRRWRRQVRIAIGIPLLWLSAMGCASPGGRINLASSNSAAAAMPSAGPQAGLTLAQIEPTPTLSEPTEQVDRAIPRAALTGYLIGLDLYRQYRWSEAAEALSDALRQDPGSADIHRLLGLCYWRQGRAREARRHLERSAELDPDQVTVQSTLGRIAQASDDEDEAIARWRLALQCGGAGPRNAETVLAWLELGRTLIHRGYLVAGLEQLDQYLQAVARPNTLMFEHPELAPRLRRGQADVVALMGKAFTQLGWYRQGVELLSKAVDAEKKNRQFRADFVQALALDGQFDRAEGLARELLADAPDGESIELLAWVYDRKGWNRQRVADLQAAIADHSDQPEVALALIDVLVRRDYTNPAIEALRTVVEGAPHMTRAYWRLARLLHGTGRKKAALLAVADAVRATTDAHAEATTVLADLFDVDSAQGLVGTVRGMQADQPDDFATALVAGLMYRLAGQLVAAEQALQQSLDLDTQRSGGFLELGRLQLEQYRWADAIRTANTAIEADHDVAGIYVLLGQAYDGLDKADDAIKAYQASFRLSPRDGRVIRALARLHDRLGRWRAALRHYKLLIAMDSHDADAHEALLNIYIRRNDLLAAQGELAAIGQTDGPRAARSATRLALQVHRDQDKYLQALWSILEQYPDDFQTRYMLAEGLVASRRYAEGLAELEQLHSVDPKHAGVREHLARVYGAQMAYSRAIAVMDDLLTEHPNRETWLRMVAGLCRADWQHDRAIAVLERLVAMRDQPEGSAYRRMLADTYITAGQPDRAERFLLDWLDADPGSAIALDRLIILSDDEGRLDTLADRLVGLLVDQPEEAGLRRQLLVALSAADRSDEAVLQLLGWLAEESDSFELCAQLVMTLVLAGRADEAVTLAEEYTIDANRSRDYRWLLSRVCWRAGRYDRAIGLLEALTRGDGAGGRLEEDLIRLLIDADRTGEAIKLGRRVIQDQPEMRRSMLRLMAAAYEHQGRLDLAAQQLEIVHNLDRYDPTINNDLGYMWADAGMNLDQAERMIHFALGERPTEPAYLDSLGWVLYKMGRFDDAVHYLTRATQLPDGRDALIYDHLGDAAWSAGDAAMARTNWQRAVMQALKVQAKLADPMQASAQHRAQGKLDALEAGRPPEVAPQPSTLERSDK